MKSSARKYRAFMYMPIPTARGLMNLWGLAAFQAWKSPMPETADLLPPASVSGGMCLKKKIIVEDYTNFQMALRFLAGAMGVPFLPTMSSLGTDIIAKWGFDTEMRQKNKKISAKKLVVVENPFSRNETPEKLVLVPAIQPDVTLIHVQQADVTGTCRISGLTFSDVDQAKASRHVIVTCDELVDSGTLNYDPQCNQLPSFCVDAVVHVPFGAYPTACFGLYDYDAQFLNLYRL